MGSILKAFCLRRCKNGLRNPLFFFKSLQRTFLRQSWLMRDLARLTQLKKGDVNRRTLGNEGQRQRACSAAGPVTRRKEALLTHALGPSYCQGRELDLSDHDKVTARTQIKNLVIQQPSITSFSSRNPSLWVSWTRLTCPCNMRNQPCETAWRGIRHSTRQAISVTASPSDWNPGKASWRR